MKKACLLLLLCLLPWQNLWAKVKPKLGLELPLVYSFDQADDGGALAADLPLLGLNFSFMAGVKTPVGLELQYTQIPLADWPEDQVQRLVLLLLAGVPNPWVDLTLGVGQGITLLSGLHQDSFDQSKRTYAGLVRLGLAAKSGLGYSVSLQRVASTLKLATGDRYLEVGGWMASAGVSYQF